MTTPAAALAVIDTAVEDWLEKESRVRSLAPMVALALHAAGYEIRPAGVRGDPVSVDALLEGLRHAGYELRPARKDTAA